MKLSCGQLLGARQPFSRTRAKAWPWMRSVLTPQREVVIWHLATPLALRTGSVAALAQEREIGTDFMFHQLSTNFQTYEFGQCGRNGVPKLALNRATIANDRVVVWKGLEAA